MVLTSKNVNTRSLCCPPGPPRQPRRCQWRPVVRRWPPPPCPTRRRPPPRRCSRRWPTRTGCGSSTCWPPAPSRCASASSPPRWACRSRPSATTSRSSPTPACSSASSAASGPTTPSTARPWHAWPPSPTSTWQEAANEHPADCGCTSSCCGDSGATQPDLGAGLYTADEQGEVPETALLASLGCGNPTAVADLHQGETVLDLGSGGGIDVLLSAKRVGRTGHAYGLDMTEEMLALARRNAQEAGAGNVTFLKGHIEQIPLPADSVDVVISNCVINLSVDKPTVFREIGRVVRPGGRIGISDVVAEDRLTAAERARRGSYVGCIAGALSKGEYEAGLEAAGFEQVSVEFTHRVADGMHGAIVKAVKA